MTLNVIQALLAVPRLHLLVEMGYTDRHSRLSPATWALAETGARPDLAEATQAAYQALVQPYWIRIRACLHAEQAARREGGAVLHVLTPLGAELLQAG